MPMVRLLVATSDGLDRLARAFMSWALGVIVVLVVSEVASRNLFNYSFTWLEEVTVTYLGTWLVFVGGSHAMKLGLLASVEFFVKLLPHRLAIACAVVSDCIIFLFLAIVIFYGSRLALLAGNQPSSSLQWSMGYAYLGIVVGACFMAVHVLAAAVDFGRIRTTAY
jgi:TRAP-type C4-dicarboxylate transport system permease small subunit